jgi:hypothetical protein
MDDEWVYALLVIGIIICCILFAGKPDLMDAIIEYIRRN